MRWENDLTFDIRCHDGRDDLDWNNERDFAGIIPYTKRWSTSDQPDFSQVNCEEIAKQYEAVKDNCKFILEIGVSRNGKWKSSSDVLIETKNKDTIYLGIDIVDKSHLDDPENNVYTMQCRSEEFDKVRARIKELGVDKIDFYFIDGYHSINQVLLEWEYTDLLSDHAIVGWHDTRCHPGPHMFVKALDKSKWDVIENACDYKWNDWGIGFAKKKQ